MKWPKHITIIRHGQSTFNVLREQKAKDPLYQKFKRDYEEDFESSSIRKLAEEMKRKYVLSVSDYKTPLTELGLEQAYLTGQALSQTLAVPDIIFCSPYLRTVQTFKQMQKAWSDLKTDLMVSEDRIREQEHGQALLYNDWRLFHVYHPEQKRLRDLLGQYWYQFPQGESIPEVRDRVRLLIDTLIREWAGKDVWLITHHMTILSIRALMERLTPEQFIELDQKETPINCGVTRYTCNPELGRNGKMEIEFYNRKFY